MSDWRDTVRSGLVVAQVHLRLRENDQAKEALRESLGWVPWREVDLCKAIVNARAYVLLGNVGSAGRAIDEAIALLDGVARSG